MLASVAPGCTFNCVAGSKVVAKYRLQVPERIYNLPNISCKNALCMSNPKNKQFECVAYFERVPFYTTSVLPDCAESEFLYVCRWCRWPHVYEDRLSCFCYLVLRGSWYLVTRVIYKVTILIFRYIPSYGTYNCTY
ncbi:pyrBI [Symbiodinium sp. CCMP2592]|nr:pyrBI [Symbiodinium sp. CCMP2592]